MKLRCIAVDDEPFALKQMSNYIDQTPFLELIEVCQSAFEAMEVLNSKEVDLMFLDIQMPDLNGIEFIRTMNVRPLIIFTTAYSEFALEGFRIDALDYLLKPFSYEIFLKSALKARKQFELTRQQKSYLENSNEYLFVRSDYKTVKVRFDDIVYIEGMREYVRIHLLLDKPIMTLISMKSIEEHLPSSVFMRVHKSFIVNLDKIKEVDRSRILFANKSYIPIGEQYKQNLDEYIKQRAIR